MSKLDGKVAVVTGASKGIGAAIAKNLAQHGAAIVVNYASSRAGADAVVEAIMSAGGKAIAVKADVSKAEEAQVLIEAAVNQFGRLDVLVNNSGIYEFATIEDVTEEHYRRLFDVNVLGVLLTTQAAVKHLGENGSIVNISSAINPCPYTGRRGLCRNQGGIERYLGRTGQRARATQDPGQCGQPRLRSDRRHPYGRSRRFRHGGPASSRRRR